MSPKGSRSGTFEQHGGARRCLSAGLTSGPRLERRRAAGTGVTDCVGRTERRTAFDTRSGAVVYMVRGVYGPWGRA